MKGFYKMGRVVVVTFDENEEEKLNEILHLIFDYPHKHYTFKHFEI